MIVWVVLCVVDEFVRGYLLCCGGLENFGNEFLGIVFVEWGCEIEVFGKIVFFEGVIFYFVELLFIVFNKVWINLCFVFGILIFCGFLVLNEDLEIV